MTAPVLDRGLTTSQAALAHARDGPNVLPAPKRRSLILRLLAEMTHFFALMLWVAVGLAALAGMPPLAVAIAAVIVFNAVFSFIQEARADRAAERLSALLPTLVTVVRDGRQERIDAADVVVGDLVVLRPGDRIPADGHLVRAISLEVDTSMLTGESVPIDGEVADPVWAGTFAVAGEGELIVDATGHRTRLAEIARLATVSRRPETPLSRELRRVVRLIAVISLTVGAVFFGVTMLLGGDPRSGLVFAIGVTVALVPEALLPTVTLTLAWGAEQMAKRHVLVRNLEAVETLGSTTVICTDKTGTLTRNEMTVVRAWTPVARARVGVTGYTPDSDVRIEADAHAAGSVDARASVEHLAQAAVLSSDGYVRKDDGAWRPHGDPMEAALDSFARRLDLDTDALRLQLPDARFPFDPRRRLMSVVLTDRIVVKGAPDAVLPLCADTGAAHAELHTLTAEGLRVIAVAERARTSSNLPASAGEAEDGLTLLGLLALEDPPRPEVGASIQACRSAGVAIVMVTGDHPRTARAIADEVGLRAPRDLVLVGSDLPADDTALGELIDHTGTVIARVSPEDKLRIARALRGRGHVVAMTGDGVNDVPALHEADIGIAMGRSGTDVARAEADLVLLDDRFASIVAGVEQGRATYANVRRFLTYHLTDNVAELAPFLVWGLTGGAFPLALGVLQIIAIDIGTDTLSAVALGAEPPSRRILSGPPISGRLMNRTVLLRAFGILGPTVAVMTLVAFVVSFVAAGWRPGAAFPTGTVLLAASGAAFMTVVLSQAANAFACRSATRSPWSLGWTSNRLLIPGVAIGLGLALVTVFVPAVASVLGQAPPTATGWIIAVLGAPLMLGVDAAYKAVRHHGERGVLPSHREGDSRHQGEQHPGPLQA